MTIPRCLSHKGCSTSSRCLPDQTARPRKPTPRPFASSRRLSSPIHDVELRNLSCHSWRDSREGSGQNTGDEPCRPATPPRSRVVEHRPDKVPRSSVAKRKAVSATARAAGSNGAATRSNRVAIAGVEEAHPTAHYVSENIVRSYVDSGTTRVSTDFVAETLLPTTSGKYRLRGYRHTLQKVNSSETSILHGSLPTTRVLKWSGVGTPPPHIYRTNYPPTHPLNRNLCL